MLAADRSWDALVLEDVPKSSPLATTLVDLARADGFSVAFHRGLRSPYFDLDSPALSAKFRANLRRCAKHLDALRYERITRYDRAALDEGLAIEGAGWKGERGTAIGCDAERRAFYLALVRSLAPQGKVEMEFLSVGGKRIAFGIGMEDGATHYQLKIGVDPAFHAHSPGHLLIERIAADARARGLKRFDFLGWDQGWKRKWTELAIEHTTPVLYRPSARGVLLRVLREVVRPRLAELVRRRSAPA